jgi:hypothetical protein
MEYIISNTNTTASQIAEVIPLVLIMPAVEAITAVHLRITPINNTNTVASQIALCIDFITHTY